MTPKNKIKYDLLCKVQKFAKKKIESVEKTKHKREFDTHKTAAASAVKSVMVDLIKFCEHKKDRLKNRAYGQQD